MCPPNQIQQERTEKIKIIEFYGMQLEVPLFNAYCNTETQKTEVYGATQINKYENLYNRLQRLPEDTVAGGEPVSNENVSFKERKRREREVKQQREEYKEFGKKQGLFDIEEIAALPLFQTEYGREAGKMKRFRTQS